MMCFKFVQFAIVAAVAVNYEYTIQQKHSKPYADAYEHAGDDFQVVTRPWNSIESQVWVFTKSSGDEYNIQQKSTKRFLDAYEDKDHDNKVVTRTWKGKEPQVWIVKKIDGNEYS